MKKIILLSGLLTFSYSLMAQQDPLYNLYTFSQYMINPAYAGIYNNFNANVITRKQWAGIDGSPLTNLLAVHSALTDRMGAGFLLINDRLGVNNNSEAQLSYSYKLSTGSSTFALGLQGGIIDYRYDYNDLNLAYADDEGLDISNESFSKGNFGAGVFYMTDNYYVGLSVPRILNVTVNDGITNSTRYQPHYYLSAGYVIKSRSVSSLLLKPTLLLRYTNEQVAADLSMHALFANTVWAGVTFRNLLSVAITTQVQVKRSFRLGYSFEMPTNELATHNYGTHELSLMVDLNLLKGHYDLERYF